MHEMGIASQVVKIALSSVPPDMPDAKVEQVNLKIGRLSSIVPDSLKFCFEIITQETPLNGARLKIEEIPVVAKCKACETEWIITGPVFKCEACNSGSIEILTGQELEITSIEIAD